MVKKAPLGLVLVLALLGCRAILGIEPMELAEPEPAEAGREAEAGSGETEPGDSAVVEGDTVAADVVAEDSGEAAAPPFCKTLDPQPVFCEDFDEYPLTHYWPYTSELPSSKLELDTTQYVSAPLSFLAGTQPVAAGDAARAALERRFYGSPKSEIHIEYDVRIDSSVLNAMLITHWIALGPADKEPDCYKLSFVQGAGSAYLEEALPTPSDGGARVFHKLPMTTYLPQGRWAHLKMDILLTGNPSITVAIDGVVGSSNTPIQQQWPDLNVALRLGIVYAKGPINDLSVHFDNVTLDLR